MEKFVKLGKKLGLQNLGNYKGTELFTQASTE